MKGRLTQSDVDWYIEVLSDQNYFGTNTNILDSKSNLLINKIFGLLATLTPIDGTVRSLWIPVDRGTYLDLGNPRELIESGDYSSVEEIISDWEERYPNQIEWYRLDANEDLITHYRVISLKYKVVAVQTPENKVGEFWNEVGDFFQWMLDSVKKSVLMIEQGSYNSYILNNLPPIHKTGYIQREDIWRIWPDQKECLLRGLSPAEIQMFCSLAYSQPDIKNFSRSSLPITANDFFGYCALGYAANDYDGISLSFAEQYDLHADGRDDGLRNIDLNSPEAFKYWIEEVPHYGHPWEVCRGGSSTNIRLIVHMEKEGFYLRLTGSSFSRTNETVKFYLALKSKGIPVYLNDACILADRVRGKEIVGIVPKGRLPLYCSLLFPDEKIISYMNLPIDEWEQFAPYCKWKDIPSVGLIKSDGTDGDKK